MNAGAEEGAMLRLAVRVRLAAGDHLDGWWAAASSVSP
jgi:hypothetical protein